jgi:hypothetical protein
MKRTYSELRQEIEKRGINLSEKEEIGAWGLIFILEDLVEMIKERN